MSNRSTQINQANFENRRASASFARWFEGFGGIMVLTFCGHGAPRKAQVSWQRQGGSRQGTLSTRAKDNSWRIRSQWLENSAQTDVDVPIDIAWALWEDRTLIPKWMPWISSVEIQEEDSRLSKWTLSTYQFNRQWEFSWLALNMTPLKHQKIHWRSVPGSSSGSLGSIEIQNQGQIRFLKKGSEQCAVKLTISYEVPNALAPFANLLTPVVEGILQNDMNRFAEYAREYARVD